MNSRNGELRATGSLIALVALLMSTGCGVPVKGGIATKTEPTTAEAVRKDLVGYVFFDGKVFTPPTAQGIAVAAADLPVSEVLTAPGKNVNRGQIIIKLAMPTEKAAIQQAEANLSAAQSSLALAKNENGGALREAQRALSEARAAEKAARADVQSGGSSDLAAATEARIYAEETARAAQAELNSRLMPESQSVSAAASYLSELRSGAQVSNVRSPISGTVISLLAKVGESTTARQSLATIVDLGAIRIQGVVPPKYADMVKKGTPILVALDGPNSDPFDGVVKEVSVLPPSEGQNSAGYLAVIDFNNEKKLVQPGTIIKRLGVRTGKAENALVVPVGSVSLNSEKQTVVFVQRGTEWVAVPVEVGISDGALTEIKSGLKEGDIVRVGAIEVSP